MARVAALGCGSGFGFSSAQSLNLFFDACLTVELCRTLQVSQRTGGITTVTQKQTGDFVQLCAHFIRHVSSGSQFKGLRCVLP